ncbi:hypothetical protein [Novosphingobium jiangmenense]|uniref:Uncharacterized protein n=1 Tax=Novosphingobium jiangmenense TaxID=2791981 RepID=A0ABS0HGV2_9SPHN|nr:hypothetical protein [Novosphingobium jiangmenense]MBF9151488.1 hypothetical protein [Novosphingobium jiangmenense]
MLLLSGAIFALRSELRRYRAFIVEAREHSGAAGKAVAMQVAAKPLVEVYEALSTALDELDKHGEAMAALHLAMAVDCLASCISAEPAEQTALRPRPYLRLVTTS